MNIKKLTPLALSALIYHLSSSGALAQFQDQYTDYYAAIGLRSDLAAGKPGTILSHFLPYLLTIAGLILFGMLLYGGFTMLTGAASKDSQEQGKKMVTSSITGFVIIFLAYWIAQILQVIFKIGIVSQ